MGNNVKKPGFAKMLVLACVFMRCYYWQREMTVLEFLYFDPRLKSRYGRHPNVLSNLLGRYCKQGLLYRRRSLSIGRPFYYGMTKKGFERLKWFVNKPKFQSYFYNDPDFMVELLSRLISFVDKKERLSIEMRGHGNLEEILNELGKKRYSC